MRPLSRSIVILLLTLVFAGGGTVLAAQLFDLEDPVDVQSEEVAPSGDPDAGKLGDEPQFAEDRVLVGFERGTTSGERDDALEAVDAEEVARIGRTTVAELPDDTDVEEAAAELAEESDVAFAEPDQYRRLDGCDACWQLGDTPGINARAAHAAGETGEGSVVAVLDTGVADIADLAGKVAGRRACHSDGTCEQDATTAGNHGTMVASLIAAADDGEGITGAAPGATVKSWRVAEGGIITTSAVLAALSEVAADPDVNVVSMSFSGPMPSTAERLAIQAVLDRGKSVVGSAGNDGSYVPQYPAAYRGVIAVGAADEGGKVATFSSYGKVDVVAPGVCVPASAPAGAGSSPGCPAPSGGVVHVNGTSFSTPLVSGVLALRHSGSALRNRLGIQGTAVAPPTGDAVEAKREGHGLVDAGAWLASFAEDADPYLVLEAADQIPHPSTTVDAYVLTTDGKLAEAPGELLATGIASPTAAFDEVSAGVYRASLATGNLPAGSLVVTATAVAPSGRVVPPTTTTEPPPETTVAEPTTTAPEPTEPTEPPDTTLEPSTTLDEPTTTEPDEPEPTAPPETTVDPGPAEPPTTTEPPTTSGPEAESLVTKLDAGPVQVAAAVPVRVLRPDDQAPGVALLGAGLNPGYRADSLQGGGAGDPADDDVDDVFRVRLEQGDTIRLVLTPQAGKPIGAALFWPGTTDVLGELDRIVAQSGAIAADGTATLSYLAPSAGNYLVDVYTTGLESGAPGKGTYQLATTITRQDALDLTQTSCSPNDDGSGDACRWTVLDQAASTVRSLVLSPSGLVLSQSVGDGEHLWDGTDLVGTPQPDGGGYLLRVLFTGAGGVAGHTLIFEQRLTLDRVKPSIADPNMAPNPFEPIPLDGDRDTTVFAITSNERSFMRVYVYDANGSQKAVFQSGYANAGRIRVNWNGAYAGATLPRGAYAYAIQVVDPAGNRSATARLPFTIN